MKLKQLVFVSICTYTISAGADVGIESETNLDAWLEELPEPWKLTEESLNEVLPKFHRQFPVYLDRLKALAHWRIGTPYKIFNLGEEQAPDPDPIFRMDVSDCTSHILTTMSLAESQSWEQAREYLIKIHYKPNENGINQAIYNKRWHFTSDRLLHHKITPQVTADYIDETKLKTVNIELNRKQDGGEFLDLDWSRLVTISYIPNANITHQLLETLPDMIGVAFVKESYFPMGVVMAHEGMLINRNKLLHAGQIAEQTVIEDFMSYYFPEKSVNDAQNARFDGIMLFDFKPFY